MEQHTNGPDIPTGHSHAAVPPPVPPNYSNRPQPPAYPPYRPEKKSSWVRSFFRAVFRMIFILSIILNIYLLIVVGIGMQQQTYRQGKIHQKIALIDLSGTVNMRVADEIRDKLRLAADDEAVLGVVLVVNSPGGYVPPTELIHRYLTDFKKKTHKPLYVAIQQVGASGAYWVSTAADKIYAQTDSVVGSIGVIYISMVVENALKDKLGIDPVVVKSSRAPFKDQMSPFRQPTDKELADIQADLDRVHERFVKVVSQGRDISVDQTWPLANGDIHDGPEAVELKLIDQVGFLDDAIDDMADELGISEPHVIRYLSPPTLREMITAAKTAADAQPLDIHRQLEKWAMTPKIMALWPGQ